MKPLQQIRIVCKQLNHILCTSTTSLHLFLYAHKVIKRSLLMCFCIFLTKSTASSWSIVPFLRLLMLLDAILRRLESCAASMQYRGDDLFFKVFIQVIGKIKKIKNSYLFHCIKRMRVVT